MVVGGECGGDAGSDDDWGENVGVVVCNVE